MTSVSLWHIAKIGVDRFDLRVVFDRLQAVLTPQTRLLVATEGHLGRRDIVIVDPYGTRLQPICNPMRTIKISSKYRTR